MGSRQSVHAICGQRGKGNTQPGGSQDLAKNRKSELGRCDHGCRFDAAALAVVHGTCTWQKIKQCVDRFMARMDVEQEGQSHPLRLGSSLICSHPVFDTCRI
eukprot:5842712-Pleurochrysis_carterae.AAC.1